MWPRSWSSKGAVLTSRKLIGLKKKMSVLKLHQTKKLESSGSVSREFHTQNFCVSFSWFSSTNGRLRPRGTQM
jgi:hypothetical protein